jgi:hypothetical protein
MTDIQVLALCLLAEASGYERGKRDAKITPVSSVYSRSGMTDLFESRNSIGASQSYTTKTFGTGVGAVGGAVIGASIGSRIGIAAGPLGAIAGTIPCAFIGLVIGTLLDRD